MNTYIFKIFSYFKKLFILLTPGVVVVTLMLNMQTASAVQSIKMAIELEPLTQSTNTTKNALALGAVLSKAVGVTVDVVTNKSLREISRGARANEFDVMWIPSNIAVVAIVDKRFEILGYDGRKNIYVLLADPSIKSVTDLKNKTLYLPQEDSPASIFGSGVFNARGFPLSNLQAVFGYERGTYEVSMYSIQERTVTVVALPEAMAKSWLSNHPGKGRIIETSLAIPGQTLVVRKTLDSDLKLQIAAWFASTQVGAQKLSPYVAEEFNYIHGLTR